MFFKDTIDMVIERPELNKHGISIVKRSIVNHPDSYFSMRERFHTVHAISFLDESKISIRGGPHLDMIVRRNEHCFSKV